MADSDVATTRVESRGFVAAAISAFLAGAAGLGLQALLATAAALPFGSGTGPAVALATYLSAWAVGAWFAGRMRAERRRATSLAGAALFVVAPAATWTVISSSELPAFALIASAAFFQGWFLPLLARGRSTRAVAWLLAANLAGSWCGAWSIASYAVAAHGFFVASIVAGLAALVAGFVGSPSVVRDVARDDVGERVDGEIGRAASALVVGLGIAWMGGVEWALVRLGALWLGGMQDTLTAVLAASLAALALGAAILPPILPRGARGVLVGLALCAASSLWILALPHVMPSFAERALSIRALVLCVPALAPFGALVPLVHRAVAGESGARLGRLYLHESWAAWIGIPLVQFVLTPRIGLAASVGATCALGAIAALVIAPRERTRALGAAVCALLAAAWLARAEPPALRSPPLANPELTVLSFAEDRDFAVSVVDDGLIGERTLLTDGFRAAGTGRDYRYMRVLGHLPLLLHAKPQRVAVLALGTGTTVGAVSLHPEVERIDVLEIARAVVDAAPLFAEHNRGSLCEGLPGLLDDSDGMARVVVRLGDGRKTLRDSPATYDVVTMEPLLPDSPFGVHLYTEEAYEDVRRALKPGGIACQWVPPHALEPRTYRTVLAAFSASFAWSGVWLFGTQVILIGAERRPESPRASDAAPGALRSELEALGLHRESGVVGRLLFESHGPLLELFEESRALTDRDPWIAYRPRRVGAVLLGDLPVNLRSTELPLPGAWLARLSPAEAERAAGYVDLRCARWALARREAELRGVQDLPHGPTLSVRLDRARDVIPDEPELRELEAEVAFLDDLRAGVSALAADRSRDGAIAALDPLTRAAQARKERADVHAYVAVALSRMQSPAATKAWDAALARCPRLAETDVGRRARDLGLADELWRRAVATALLASADPESPR